MTALCCPKCGAVWSRPPLTARQRQVFDCVATTIRARAVAPTLAEIAQAVGLGSLSSVHDQLTALVRKGYLMRVARGHRGLALVEPT